MHTFQKLALSLAISVNATALFGQSTADQDKLLDAVRQKQAELDRRPAAEPPLTADQAKSLDALHDYKTPAVSNVPVNLAPADTAEQAKLREALRNNMGQPASGTVAMPGLSSEPGSIRSPISNTVVIPIETEQQKRETDALRKAVEAQTLDQPSKVTVSDSKASTTVKVSNSAQKKPETGAASTGSTKPMTGPGATAMASAPPMSERDAKLAELLRRYKADELTPHDYQIERAKIVNAK